MDTVSNDLNRIRHSSKGGACSCVSSSDGRRGHLSAWPCKTAGAPRGFTVPGVARRLRQEVEVVHGAALPIRHVQHPLAVAHHQAVRDAHLALLPGRRAPSFQAGQRNPSLSQPVQQQQARGAERTALQHEEHPEG